MSSPRRKTERSRDSRLQRALANAAIDARSDTEAERAAAQKRHEDFAKKWETWWAQHQDELVTKEELASLNIASPGTRSSR